MTHWRFLTQVLRKVIFKILGKEQNPTDENGNLTKHGNLQLTKILTKQKINCQPKRIIHRKIYHPSYLQYYCQFSIIFCLESIYHHSRVDN